MWHRDGGGGQLLGQAAAVGPGFLLKKLNLNFFFLITPIGGISSATGP